MARENGAYWVRPAGTNHGPAEMEPAEYRDGLWYLVGVSHAWLDHDFAEIGERIPSPDERPAHADAALAEAVDCLPIERGNMLAERQRLLDRKFAGDMTRGEAARLMFIRYGLDVWEEADASAATRAPSGPDQFRAGAEAMKEAAAEACRRRIEGHRNGFNRFQHTYMQEAQWCADAIRALPTPEPKS